MSWTCPYAYTHYVCYLHTICVTPKLPAIRRYPGLLFFRGVILSYQTPACLVGRIPQTGKYEARLCVLFSDFLGNSNKTNPNKTGKGASTLGPRAYQARHPVRTHAVWRTLSRRLLKLTPARRATLQDGRQKTVFPSALVLRVCQSKQDF